MDSTWRADGGDEHRRVLLAGGTPLTRQALATLLARPEANLEVVGEASGGAEIVSRVRELAADTVLADTRLPDAELVLAGRELRTQIPDSALVLLVTHVDARCVVALAMSGAQGHVLKTLDPSTMLLPLEALHRRCADPPLALSAGLFQWFANWSTLAGGDRKRDLQLLQLLLSGAPDVEITRVTGLDATALSGEITRLYLEISDEPAFRAPGARLARLLEQS